MSTGTAIDWQSHRADACRLPAASAGTGADVRHLALPVSGHCSLPPPPSVFSLFLVPFCLSIVSMVLPFCCSTALLLCCAGMMYSQYGPWDWRFCWDVSCDGIPFQDDPTEEDYNVPFIVDSFRNFTLQQQGPAYRGNHIMVMQGSDFQYSAAGMWFTNIDKLIHYVSQAYGDELNVFYSTPQAYAEAKLALNITYPVQKAAANGVDFFPYRDSPHSPWTGAWRPARRSTRMPQQCGSFARACAAMLLCC